MTVKPVIIILTFTFIFNVVAVSTNSVGENDLNKFEKVYIKDKIIDLRNLQVPCNPENCPSNGGFCKGDKCVCLEGYITVKDIMDHRACNYKQKQVIVGLLLECSGLIGFGHFYAGRVFYGLVKLILFYIIICFGSQFVIQFMKENSDTETAYYIKLGISTACLGVPVLWHLLDLYKWATNQYLDGSEYPMLAW